MIDRPTAEFKDKKNDIDTRKLISMHIYSQDLHRRQMHIYFQL